MASSLSVQVSTGILCASYWRGAWYVLDHTVYPDDRLASGVVSLASGTALLGLQQYVLSPSYNGTKLLVRLLPPPRDASLRARYLMTNRFVVLYGIASACVLIWRGTWLLWDEAAHAVADAWRRREPPRRPEVDASAWKPKPLAPQLRPPPQLLATSPDRHCHDERHGESSATDHCHRNNAREHECVDEDVLFYSGVASHVVATACLLGMGRFACVMAPPANVSMIRDLFLHGKGRSFLRAAKSFARSS